MSLMSGFEAQWEPRWASSRSGGPADQRGHLIDAVWASRSERVEDPAKRFWANFPAEAGSDRAIAQACFAEAQPDAHSILAIRLSRHRLSGSIVTDAQLHAPRPPASTGAQAQGPSRRKADTY
ncbi:hypothetical protein PtB15_9B586 [Puccinia triticina]|nr:hypothetical protein PtB15_9B586 [Puccinia triticina]